ncbi:hypothetical protein GW17_00006139 [Ensete ventricosum]|nr:hypothetical protein GW17_00006139 [Ensete ventricosum]
MSSRLQFFRWLIFVGRWQPRDLSRRQQRWRRKKRAAATSATAAVRLRGCRWRRFQQGCGCNWRKTGQRCTRLLRRRAAAVWSESERRLLLQRKIAAGGFLPQGSLLAAIKEDGSKRSLLAVLGSERCMLRLKG